MYLFFLVISHMKIKFEKLMAATLSLTVVIVVGTIGF